MALLLILESPRCFLPNFESIGLSVQEKKRKIYFQMVVMTWWRPSLVSDQNNFNYFFCSTVSPRYSLPSVWSIGRGLRQSFWRLFQNKLLMTRNGHWLTTVAYTDHWWAKTRMYEGWSKIIAHCVIAGYRRATWNKSMHTCIALFNTYTINLIER